MHTNPQARVYLHPAAITSMGAVRAIEAITGRLAYVARDDHRVHLLTPAEVAHAAAAEAKAGAA